MMQNETPFADVVGIKPECCATSKERSGPTAALDRLDAHVRKGRLHPCDEVMVRAQWEKSSSTHGAMVWCICPRGDGGTIARGWVFAVDWRGLHAAVGRDAAEA